MPGDGPLIIRTQEPKAPARVVPVRTAPPAIRPWGCHNRLPFMSGHVVQTGWTITGTRKTQEIPHVMTTECQYSRDTRDDPRCAGCRWGQSNSEGGLK